MAYWHALDRPVILASKSPRRKELLRSMGLTFEVVPPMGIDEKALIDAADLAGSLRDLASGKANSVAAGHPGALVLGADTVVVVDGSILGKPADEGDARRMLRMMSGREHLVVSGVALLCSECGFERSSVVETTVEFAALSEDDIQSYLSRAAYRDKAGAYGIQEDAMVFIPHIRGCYFNVVGLPVHATVGLFQAYQDQGSSHDV